MDESVFIFAGSSNDCSRTKKFKLTYAFHTPQSPPKRLFCFPHKLFSPVKRYTSKYQYDRIRIPYCSIEYRVNTEVNCASCNTVLLYVHCWHVKLPENVKNARTKRPTF